jgi:D-alanyl-lipoteichoic acid acyltransferase DltB (MBOAT superfamily)
VKDSLVSLIGTIRFSSGQFLVFLTAAVVIYYLLPGVKTRTAWLLCLSLGFYALLSPYSVLVLLVVAGIGYVTGRALASGGLGRSGESPVISRKTISTAAVVLVIGVLGLFKYLGFMAFTGERALIAAGLSVSIPVLRLALPLGVSFWTFQAIAYVVDVYRGKTAPERNPFVFLLSVSFFPLVTAGPITRVQDLAAQLRLRHTFDYDGMNSGLLLIGVGFFKKLVIADRVVVFVDRVFASPRAVPESGSSLLLLAAVFFAVQLYCDFSGYTDIVRGSALLFGVELPVNFRTPYFACSMRDFWRRWHITLMDWFREYVYIPLGGSRVGRARRYLNIMLVFALSGLWHGAGFTYIAWGLLNGFYQVAGLVLAPLNDWFVAVLRVDRDTLGHRAFQTVLTFTLVTTGWVFFRAGSVADALYIVRRMFIPTPIAFADGTVLQYGMSAAELAVAAVAVAVLFGAEWLSLRVDVLERFRRQHLVYRWATYYTLVAVIVVFGAYGGAYNPADFLYFKY